MSTPEQIAAAAEAAYLARFAGEKFGGRYGLKPWSDLDQAAQATWIRVATAVIAASQTVAS